MTKKITLQIDIEENIAELYPNYKRNFKDEKEFVQFLLDDIVVDNSLFGYTIKLVKNEKDVGAAKT